MNARRFFDEFSTAVKEKKLWAETGENYLTVFRTSPDRFKQIICNDIVPQIMEKAGLSLPRRPSADVVGRLARCVELDSEYADALGLKLSLWDMKAAVEFELDAAGWINRLIKLVHLRCPLKVLICFSDSRGDDEIKLRFAAKCMKRISAFDPKSNEEYLVIVGNTTGENAPAECFNWQGYSYDYEERSFLPLFEEYNSRKENESDFRFERFESVQKNMYERALREIKQGRKKSHWMWYIFPQFRGLGSSNMSSFFSIASLDEARAYLKHPVLGARLREISAELLKKPTDNPEEIFGGIDSIKLRSSMTLFECADPDCAVFGQVLDKYFKGKRDIKTLDLLGMNEDKFLELV